MLMEGEEDQCLCDATGHVCVARAEVWTAHALGRVGGELPQSRWQGKSGPWQGRGEGNTNMSLPAVFFSFLGRP